jgi:hypothetical protein
MAGRTKTYAQLPDDAVAFLSDLDAGDFASAFLKKFGSVAKPDDVLNLVDDVVLGAVPLADVPAALQKLGIPADKADAAAVELASARLLPIAGVVGDVQGQMGKWKTVVPVAKPTPAVKPTPVAKAAPPKPVVPPPAPKPKPAPVPQPKPVASPLAGKPTDAFSDEDEKEAQRIAAKANVAAVPTGEILDPKAIADQVAKAAKLAFATPELKKRFELVVDARTRDVRDAFETRNLLEQPSDKSGLGITGGTLANAVEALERLIGERKAALDAYAEKERERSTAKLAEDRRARGAATQMKEERELAKRFGELTGVVDAGVVEAAVTAQARPAPRMSAATLKPSGKPKVEEIRFAQRLAGPVDELRLLTLTEFRRLSKDPAEAARRVAAKVSMLEEQGYEQKIAAVKAWKESPLHGLTLALSAQALAQGKPLSAVAEEWRGEGKEVPTADELAAIASLNGSLRF